MAEIMTDKQFDKIIQMISMILDGCEDLDDAKKKIAALMDDRKKSSREEE